MRHKHTALLAALILAGCAQAGKPAAGAAPAIEDQEPDVTRQVQSILEQVARGGLAQEALTDNARGVLVPARLHEMGAAVRSCGAIPQLQLLERKTKGEDRMYVYRAPCGGKPVLVEIDFSKGARINRLVVRRE